MSETTRQVGPPEEKYEVSAIRSNDPAAESLKEAEDALSHSQGVLEDIQVASLQGSNKRRAATPERSNQPPSDRPGAFSISTTPSARDPAVIEPQTSDEAAVRSTAGAPGPIDFESDYDDQELLVHAIVDEELATEVRGRLLGESVEATSAQVVVQVEPAPPKKRNRCRHIWLLVVLAAAVVVGVVVGLTQRGNDESNVASPPTAAPSLVLSESDLALLEMLQSAQDSLDYAPYSEYNPLTNTSSPQYKAYLSMRDSWLDFYSGDLLSWYALRSFFFSTGGAGWTRKTLWLSNDHANAFCAFFTTRPEATCADSLEDGTPFPSLFLRDNDLLGTIPPELAFLSSRLRFMDLALNDLRATIPETLYKLTLLQELDLAANAGLSGTFLSDERIQELKRLHLVNISGTNLEPYQS